VAERPLGYHFICEDVFMPLAGQCWLLAVYENAQGERWGERWPITREKAWNIVSSPFWKPRGHKEAHR
jgi:hypothetical protein